LASNLLYLVPNYYSFFNFALALAKDENEASVDKEDVPNNDPFLAVVFYELPLLKHLVAA
jgi:hypothetical protein